MEIAIVCFVDNSQLAVHNWQLIVIICFYYQVLNEFNCQLMIENLELTMTYSIFTLKLTAMGNGGWKSNYERKVKFFPPAEMKSHGKRIVILFLSGVFFLIISAKKKADRLP